MRCRAIGWALVAVALVNAVSVSCGGREISEKGDAYRDDVSPEHRLEFGARQPKCCVDRLNPHWKADVPPIHA